METKTAGKQTFVIIVFSIVIFGGLAFISFYNFPLFHALAELSSIIIACGIFMVALATRRITNNDYLLFLGLAYASVAALDLMHTLTYKGMGIFPDLSANVPTQLWIAARYTESLSLLAAPLFLTRKLPVRIAAVFYTGLTAVVFLLIFLFKVFPDCFREESGLTLFKIISEYVICAVILLAIFNLRRRRFSIDPRLYVFMIVSLTLTIFAELAFTLYINVFGIANMIGHLLKIASFYLIYKAVIENSLKNPYAVLFGDMVKQNEALATEISGRARTETHLRNIIENLKKENSKVAESLNKALYARNDIVQRMAFITMKKADTVQEHAKLVQAVHTLQYENEVLQEQLEYYLKLFEQTKGDISSLLQDERQEF